MSIWASLSFVISTCLGIGMAQAADLFVQQGVGSNGNPGDGWGEGHAVATIQRALNMAANRTGADTIHVAAGTYAEHLTVGSDVTLLGSYPPEGGGGESRNRTLTPTIIDGSGAGVPITINSVDRVLIDRFVVTNGRNAQGENSIGGGVSLAYSSQVRLTDNLIENNWSDNLGGGVGIHDSTGVSLIGNRISGNLAQHGGGISLYGESPAVLARNILLDNTTTGSGGGLYARYAALTLTGNRIQGNTADDGGGVAIDGCETFMANDNRIESNQALHDGGGLYHQNCAGRLLRNAIQRNRAGNWGGGVCVLHAGHVETMTNNLITDNRADGNGGGVSLYDQSSAIMLNNTLARNRAEYGGGLFVDSGTQATVRNSILWANRSGAVSAGDNQQITRSGTGTARVTYSAIEGSWPGTANIDAAPRFQLVDDYHLTAQSPCRDTARDQGAPRQDLDGNLRPDGATTDMGAYEWSPAPDLTGAWTALTISADGRDLAATVRVRNPVTDQDAGVFEVSFYLSDEGEVPRGRAFATITLGSGLAGGTGQNLRLEHTFDTSILGQSLLAVIDSARQIRERSERNNLIVQMVDAP